MVRDYFYKILHWLIHESWKNKSLASFYKHKMLFEFQNAVIFVIKAFRYKVVPQFLIVNFWDT